MAKGKFSRQNDHGVGLSTTTVRSISGNRENVSSRQLLGVIPSFITLFLKLLAVAAFFSTIYPHHVAANDEGERELGTANINTQARLSFASDIPQHHDDERRLFL